MGVSFLCFDSKISTGTFIFREFISKISTFIFREYFFQFYLMTVKILHVLDK